MSVRDDLRDCLRDQLGDIELFAGLDVAELDWLAGLGEMVTLADGEVLFSDGQLAEHFYVLLTGELLITKTFDGRVEVVARHSVSGDTDGEPGKPAAANRFTGELPMLAGGGYVARGTAVGPTTLLAYDQTAFLEMISRCPQVCRVLLPVMAWRIRSYEVQAGRRAMLTGLGTLAAGLAHELNNPTAAVVRAATELRGLVPELTSAAAGWARAATPAETAMLSAFGDRLASRSAVRDPFDVADALDELTDRLAAAGLPDELAPILSDHCVEPADLVELTDVVHARALPAALGFLAYSLRIDALVSDVIEAGGRIAMLVRDTKSYTNLDRAPVGAVDLTEGLDATLSMHAAKLAGIRVCRSYDPALPLVSAYPSELNQVWANLIDNAADAMNGTGILRISTRVEGNTVVVEIRDDGVGIPPAALGMLFQPFFTTKDIGKGTGLGLHLSHGIVTVRHRGTFAVTSVPGDTRFTVRLPLE